MFFLGEFANVWILCAVSVSLFLGGWQIPFGTEADGITPAGWLVSTTGLWFTIMAVGAALPALAIGVQLFRYRGRAHAAISKAKVPGSLPTGTRLALKGAYDGALVTHVLAALGLVAFGLFQLNLGGIWTAIREPLVINGLQLGIFMAKTLLLVFIVIQLRWTLPRIRVDQMMTLCWKYLVPLSFVCVVGTMFWELVLEATKFGMSRSPLDYLMRWAMLAAFAWTVFLYTKKIRAAYEVDRENYQNQTGHEAYFPPWRLV
jgi:hypothetical protein